MMRQAGSLFVVFLLPGVAAAQSLVWQLPAADEKVEVLYRGKFTQENVTAGSGVVEDAKDRSYDQQIYIRHLGAESVMVDGKAVPARWLEFEIQTGRLEDDAKDLIGTGILGSRIYKVLVPESAFAFKLGDVANGGKSFKRNVDGEGILVAKYPVLKGFVQIGGNLQLDDAAGTTLPIATVRPFTGKDLQLHPLFTQLMHYHFLTPAGDDSVTTLGGAVAGKKYTAKRTVESRTTRVVNDASITTSTDGKASPFGPAHWKVSVDIQHKEASAKPMEFSTTRRLVEEMTLRRIVRGENVESKVDMTRLVKPGM